MANNKYQNTVEAKKNEIDQKYSDNVRESYLYSDAKTYIDMHTDDYGKVDKRRNTEDLLAQMYPYEYDKDFESFVIFLKSTKNPKFIAIGKLLSEFKSLDKDGVFTARSEFKLMMGKPGYLSKQGYKTTYKELQKIKKRGNIAHKKHSNSLAKYKKVRDFYYIKMYSVLSDFSNQFASYYGLASFELAENFNSDSLLRTSFEDFCYDNKIDALLTNREAERINRR